MQQQPESTYWLDSTRVTGRTGPTTVRLRHQRAEVIELGHRERKALNDENGWPNAWTREVVVRNRAIHAVKLAVFGRS
jgi:hypothetical protein